MLIKARLQGHEFDLLTLAELFREGDPAVAADEEGYYLRFSVPDELFGDGGGLHDAASVLLRRVNGVARTLTSDTWPVGLTGRFSDETGRHHQFVLADPAEVRARANPVRVSVGGKQAPAPQHRVRAMCGWPKPTRTSPRSWTCLATPSARVLPARLGDQGPNQYVHCLGQPERGPRRPGPSCPPEG